MERLRVVVIGAGMAGVLMGIRLLQSGVRELRIFEKGGCVGGTWRENSYPGLHCDFPSHVYRYSFEPNPDWPQRFSPGPEIRRYFENAAKKYGVHDRIAFDTEIVKAEWMADRWAVTTGGGAIHQADAIVSATGFLHVPRYPEIEGLADFAGPCFHSARWDHRVDLDGRRVGLIGAGSTATQLVCALADRVAKLSIFQRTPQWVARIDNPPITEEERASFRADPRLMETMFRNLYREMVALADGAIQGRDAGMRQWLEQNVRENLATVKDPELRRRLTPNYAPGLQAPGDVPGLL